MKVGLLDGVNTPSSKVFDATPASMRPKAPRVYYVDWLRVIAIYLVVSYHIVQALDWVGFYNSVGGASAFVVSFRASALQIGMPMFFHISGRAHALSPAMGLCRTVVKKAQRLIAPFLCAYILLIPPWQYIDKEYDWNHPSVFHMKENPITWFLNYYFTETFFIDFDMAWLWFLPALYFILVMASPLFIVAEQYNSESKKGLRWATIWAVILWSLLAAGIRGSGFTWWFTFFSVIGPVCAVAIAHWIPVPPNHARGEDIEHPMRMWKAMHIYTLLQVAATIGIPLSFGYETIDPPQPNGKHDPRAGMPFIILCLSFYVHGFFVQRWSKGSARVEEEGGDAVPWWIWQYKLFSAFMIALCMLMSSPQGDVESGHYIYPIYSNTYKEGSGFGAMHVLGTWVYIGLFVSLFEAYADHQGDKTFHKHATQSSMIVYIFHWIFIKVFAFWWVNPTLWRLSSTHKLDNAWVALVVSMLAFVVCVSLSLGIYAALLRLPCVGRLFGL